MSDTVNDLLHMAEGNLSRENDIGKALEFIEEALKVDAKSLKALVLKGVSEMRMGLSAKAIHSFDRVLQIDGDNSEANLNLAVLHIKAGDYEKAKNYIDRVLSKSTNGDAFELLGDMASLKEIYDDGIHFYAKAIEMKPSDANVYYKKALCHYKIRQFKDCYKYAELAAELKPTFRDAVTLAEISADNQVYGGFGLFAKLCMRPLRPYLKRQLKEQIQIHDEMLKIEKRTAELSVDPLMKIKNRSYFENSFPNFCDTARKNSQPVALLFFDLDNMKIFNELFGHPVLDKILSLIGEIFNNSVKSFDIPARYAGDEFIIALQNCDKKGAQAVLDMILVGIDQMNKVKLPHLKVTRNITFSVGIACAPDDMEDPGLPWHNQLVEKADLAALWAKHHGKSQACVYDLKRKDEFRQLEHKITHEAKAKAKNGIRA